MTPLCLIPQPQVVAEGEGRFPLRDSTQIVLSSRAERGEWVAARAVQDALAARGLAAPIYPQTSCKDTAGAIVLAVRGRDEDIFPTAPPMEGVAAHREAYGLRVGDVCIAVWGATPAGLAQGARTLTQLLRQVGDGAADADAAGVPALAIADAPALEWRGALLDVSRGKAPTLDTLKRLVDVLCSYKINMLQLYVEHTFAFRSHPRIGQGWGALTPEDIADLDAYCRDRYVELIPCLQSLGHHHDLLALPDYAHLAFSAEGWTLRPDAETYALLDDLYDDFLAAFSSPYFNVCCDEPYDLTHTTGRTHLLAAGYLAGAGAASGGAAAPDEAEGAASREGLRRYLDHILRLHEMLARRGKTMMMWDDVFLHAPDLLPEAPRDIVMLNWFYLAADDYPQVELFRKAGFRQIVCPGTSTWNTLFPHLDIARANIRNLVTAGLRAGALGVLTTDWGDNGHPNALGSSWYGFLYGALEGWSPARLDDAEFERRFGLLVFGAGAAEPALEAMRALSEACTLPGIARYRLSYSRILFFEDPLAYCGGIPDTSLARMDELGARAHALLRGLRGVDDEAAITLDELRLAARQVTHAARKALAGRRIAALPEEGPRPALYAQLQELKRELHALRRDYERVWVRRNKPQGLWLTLDQFDRSACVLDGWAARVQPPPLWPY